MSRTGRVAKEGQKQRGPGFLRGPVAVPPRGLEPLANPAGKTQIPHQGGAKPGAPEAETTAVDPDLAAVIEAWPQLPEPIRRAVLTLVSAAMAPKANHS